MNKALLDGAFGIVRAQENSIAEIGSCQRHRSRQKYEDGKMDILTEGPKRFQIVQLIAGKRSLCRHYFL